MENRKNKKGLLLAALGMVYGDIAVSPLYLMRFIVSGNGGAAEVSESLITGSLSLILWSVLLLAAGKGVLILLRADNRGEGGHLALYALLREHSRRLLIPAALGCAALLADAVLTPALTMTSAVEGLRFMPMPWVAGISGRGIVLVSVLMLTGLFSVQAAGSGRTGRFLGPVMLLWLLFIGVAGLVQLPNAPSVLRAFDPLNGFRFLRSADDHMGYGLLGLVFLAVTGTEILYANLDFAGRKAITMAWPFVMVCLFLSYLGQGAWLLCHIGDPALLAAAETDTFFLMLPGFFRIPALLLALAAAWTASQAVINGSFTLVSEAIRLEMLPALKIRWPSDAIQWEYIPSVNLALWAASCLAVPGFRAGERMASAYGFSTALAMLMTTILLYVYHRRVRGRRSSALIVLLLFGVPETVFLTASIGKLAAGGFITALITTALFLAMLCWNRAGEIEKRYAAPLKLTDHIRQLEQLRSASAYPRFTDNLVYVEAGDDIGSVDKAILWSVLERDLKRARTYWFISVHVSGEPYAERCEVETFGTDFLFRVKLELGFKCAKPVTWYLRKLFRELQEDGVIKPQKRDYCLEEDSAYGAFHYCVLRKVVSDTTVLAPADILALRVRDGMQRLAGSREEWFAEEDTDVSIESVPLDPDEQRSPANLVRVWPEKTDAPGERPHVDREEGS